MLLLVGFVTLTACLVLSGRRGKRITGNVTAINSIKKIDKERRHECSKEKNIFHKFSLFLTYLTKNIQFKFSLLATKKAIYLAMRD